MTSVAVIVPWRDIGDPMRQRNWARVRSLWETDHPDYRLIVTDVGGEPFSRGASINDGVRRAGKPDVLVVADADVITVPGQVRDAVAAATEAPGMVQPFSRYIPLDAHTTGVALDDGGIPWRYADYPVATWICVSACTVMTSQSFVRAGGFDERFKGWGYEDSAFDLMMACKVGLRRNIEGPAWHLAHPGAISDPADPQHQANLNLWLQYQLDYTYPS